MIREKEKNNLIVFKTQIDNFDIVSRIFSQRFEQNKVYYQPAIEDLETAIDDENSNQTQLIHHKRNKQQLPIKSLSISSKYIKDIVSKKNPQLTQQSPIKKSEILKKCFKFLYLSHSDKLFILQEIKYLCI